MRAHDDDDFRIGVPTAGRPAPAPSGVAPSPGSPLTHRERFTASESEPTAPLPSEYRDRRSGADPDVELREGETELGRPPQVPTDLKDLSDDDLAALKLLTDEQAARDLAEAELLLASDAAGLGWLGWFGSPLMFAFMLGAFGIFGIFLFNQTVSLLNQLAAQPQWAQYVGYAGLALFGVCVLYSGVRFVLVYVRLRENRQLRVRGVAELSKRTRLRWLASAKSAEARGMIEAYLANYPMKIEKERKVLSGLGITDEVQGRLAAVRDELLDPDRFASTEQWLTHFRDHFQTQLDVAAEARVKYWASRIWVVTAIAPNAVVDSGATLFYTFSMLSELCQIYSLRAGRTGTAVLLGRVFFNAYLAGQGADLQKLAEDQYDQLFHEAMKVVGVGVSSNMIGKMLGKVGAKATTGYLNRVLLIRLGRYACRLLRPVTRD